MSRNMEVTIDVDGHLHENDRGSGSFCCTLHKKSEQSIGRRYGHGLKTGNQEKVSWVKG